MEGNLGSIRVSFTSDIFEYQAKGGIGRYFSELFAQLQQRSDCDATVDAWVHCCTYLRDKANLRDKTSLLHPRIAPYYLPKFRGAGNVLRFLNRVSRPLRNQRVDIRHWTYYPKVDVDWSVPNVVTFYDMIHEKIANKQKLLPIKKVCAENASHLIAISECTKRDMVEWLQVSPNRITVVPLASDLHCRFTQEAISKRWELLTKTTPIARGRFILWVGARHGYKNFQGLIHALNQSRYKKEIEGIVCVGGEPFTPAERAGYGNELGAEFPIHSLNADDLSLAALYSHAFCFVCLSLYEGFGIPPLEAMGLGCPVISSNRSSLPEVVGEAGFLVDPERPEEVSHAIDSLWEFESLRSEFVRLGEQRAGEFSWKRCAEETWQVYRHIVDDERAGL
ncbi:D-inositol 3-phosphate glycosyltransferase [Pirellula sp. SH-Sr6A]|uniref:glycosyltransferase family 4 protein n=1 Tax=Pirellula sp. SH-Sr6A TaxID=1632865 RepID=UPI00078D8362|nr:glycosyltransferase family 1 protein [Pirellula sp. SH-Sr6A]AMV35034.1 D-inositol 3-phosphate glycosyltransferase [Pirellula sp. SH-Sr6A]